MDIICGIIVYLGWGLDLLSVPILGWVLSLLASGLGCAVM